MAAAIAKLPTITPADCESLGATGDCDVIPHKAFPHNSRDFQQRTRLDSNQRPSVSKTDALSTETLENKAVLNVENREVAVVRAVETENATQNTTNDPDLVALFEAWATLPAAIKVGIMAMVRVGK